MNIQRLAPGVLSLLLLTACQIDGNNIVGNRDKARTKTACNGSNTEEIWVDRQIGVTLPTDPHHIYQQQSPTQDNNQLVLFCDAPEGRYQATFFLRDRAPDVSSLMQKWEKKFLSQGYDRTSSSADPIALTGQEATIHIYGSDTPGWNAVVVLQLPKAAKTEKYKVRFSATPVR